MIVDGILLTIFPQRLSVMSFLPYSLTPEGNRCRQHYAFVADARKIRE